MKEILTAPEIQVKRPPSKVPLLPSSVLGRFFILGGGK